MNRKHGIDLPRTDVGPCRQMSGELYAQNGECLRCGAALGEACRQPAKATPAASQQEKR